ncbi:MAG: DUF1622 domain-containing protein [Hyphomicrobium sp.]
MFADAGARTMRDLALWTSEILDIAAFVIILLAVAFSTAVFLVRASHTGFLANYRDYRANLGRGILLGLEILIAADILKSVVVDPTVEGIAVLGGIVAIRTFLSISLDVEINGHWPGRRRASPARTAPPSSRDPPDALPRGA